MAEQTRRNFLRLLLGTIGAAVAAPVLNSHAKSKDKNDLTELLDEIDNGKKYVVVGENHPEDTIANLVLTLIDNKEFHSLYLEALMVGNYNIKGDQLKDREGVYGWNPAKYDRIINNALKKGLEVHGIDNCEGEGEDRVSKWSKYILETDENSLNLILVGSAHVNYWHRYSTDSFILPSHLVAQGISPDEMLTITAVSGRDLRMKPGVYKLNKLPEHYPYNFCKERKLADYVWVARPCWTEEALK